MNIVIRTIIFCFFTIVFSSSLKGQNIADLFKSMPIDILPGVSEANKTMLLVDSGETAVPFALGEIKKITQKNDFLKVKTSDIGTIQLKLLPVNQDSSIVCVIKTVCAEACDSHISFYTTNWENIEYSTVMPEITNDFFFDSSKKAMDNYKYAVSLHHIFPVSASFEEQSNNITLTFNYKEIMTDDQIAEMQPFLKSNTAVLQWKNGSFKQ